MFTSTWILKIFKSWKAQVNLLFQDYFSFLLFVDNFFLKKFIVKKIDRSIYQISGYITVLCKNIEKYYIACKIDILNSKIHHMAAGSYHVTITL